MAINRKRGGGRAKTRGSKRRHKTLSRQGLLGQKGVNIIERIILDMGSRWTPSGPNEVGIDGYIELFDPTTGAALGKNLAVQSKAVSQFANETEDSFNFQCNSRDLDYWLNGNMPVILIVSRPDTNEAYWVSIKDYFSSSALPTSNRIQFSKTSQRLTPESFAELSDLARPQELGLYLPPVPRSERLYSNLLPLTEFPPQIWIASTTFRKAGEVWARLRETGQTVDGAWILRDKKILTFHDLDKSPWSEVCDPGTVEGLESSHWAESNNDDLRRQFVHLLNQTLRSQLRPDVRYWPKDDCYAHVGYLEYGTQKRSYPSLKHKSSLAVVTKYEHKAKDGRMFEWLRHLAFRGQFRRFGEQWYLEITPTYRFTWDGLSHYRYHEDALKGIKRLEGNRAVLSPVLFWASHMRSAGRLFSKTKKLLEFGDLLGFDIEVGINDQQWKKQDPDAPPDEASVEQLSLLPGLQGESEL